MASDRAWRPVARVKKPYDTAQFLWVDGPLSSLERLCLASFLHHGYEVHLYTYGQVEGVPEGVVVLSGEDIIPRDQLFKAPGIQSQSYAAFSDLFRYSLLVQRGGWWFDMDMVCLRHDPPPLALTFASTWEGEHGECANGCAMWSLPGDPHMLVLRDRCLEQLRTQDVPFGSVGPFLIQDYIREHHLSRYVSPFWEFCPYPWRLIYRLAQPNAMSVALNVIRQCKHRIMQMVDPAFRAGYIRRRSRTLHLHNEMWKACGLDKNAKYCRFSLIERLRRRYCSEPSGKTRCP